MVLRPEKGDALASAKDIQEVGPIPKGVKRAHYHWQGSSLVQGGSPKLKELSAPLFITLRSRNAGRISAHIEQREGQRRAQELRSEADLVSGRICAYDLLACDQLFRGRDHS